MRSSGVSLSKDVDIERFYNTLISACSFHSNTTSCQGYSHGDVTCQDESRSQHALDITVDNQSSEGGNCVIRDVIAQYLGLSSLEVTSSEATTSEVSLVTSLSQSLDVSMSHSCSNISYGRPDGESSTRLVLGERPPCVGQETSPIRRVSEETTPKDDSNALSDLSPDFLDVTLTEIDECVESDDDSFMERSICPLGIKEDTTSKNKKSSLVQKLKKLRKHFLRKEAPHKLKFMKTSELL